VAKAGGALAAGPVGRARLVTIEASGISFQRVKAARGRRLTTGDRQPAAGFPCLVTSGLIVDQRAASDTGHALAPQEPARPRRPAARAETLKVERLPKGGGESL